MLIVPAGFADVAVRIRHVVRDRERDVVLGVVTRLSIERGMQDRCVLNDGIGAGRGVGDGDRQDRDGVTVLDLLDQDRFARSVDIGEPRRSSRERKREREWPVAAGTDEVAAGIRWSVIAVRGNTRVAIGADDVIVVDNYVDDARRREFVFDPDRQGGRRGVAVAVGQRVGEDIADAAVAAAVRR